MNENNIHESDTLVDLFNKLPLEKVSDSFTFSVMNKVEKIQCYKKRKAQLLTILLPVSGVVVVVCVTSLIFYITGTIVPQVDVDFQIILSQIIIFLEQNTLIFAIGFIVLLLLIMDFLLRNYVNNKKELQNS